jgi:excisionase family DNA binding protein
MTVATPPRHRGDLACVAGALAEDRAAAIVTRGGKSVALPDELRAVLNEAVRALRDGHEVVVVAKDSYVTAHEAADFLGVSRPAMVRVLDLGEAPYERPNSHRRIKMADLVAYKAERSRRRAALDGLLAMSDEVDQHDGGFVRTR